MSAAQLERLHEHLQRLRLFKVRERLEALLQDATTKETSYADFLDGVLTEEVASKTAKHVTMRTRLARFPFVKSLETFDFSYQPSLDKKQLRPRMVAGRAPALITDAPCNFRGVRTTGSNPPTFIRDRRKSIDRQRPGARCRFEFRRER